MEIFKISIKSHLKSLSSVLLIIIFGVFFTYFMSKITKDDIKIFALIAIGVWLVLSIPALITHINYYLINKGDQFIFENNLPYNRFTFIHKGKSIIFNIENIDCLYRYISFNLAAGRSGVVPWDEYNHSVIYLKNGEKIIITSLLIPNLNLPLEKEKIVIKRSIFRWAK